MQNVRSGVVYDALAYYVNLHMVIIPISGEHLRLE